MGKWHSFATRKSAGKQSLMIDFCGIVTRGGLVLWSSGTPSYVPLDPLSFFVQRVLLEDHRSGDAKLAIPGSEYVIRWKFDNEMQIIFVVVYLEFTSMFNVEEFLAKLMSEFSRRFKNELVVTPSRGTLPKQIAVESKVVLDFEKEFEKVEREFKNRVRNGGLTQPEPRAIPSKEGKIVTKEELVEKEVIEYEKMIGIGSKEKPKPKKNLVPRDPGGRKLKNKKKEEAVVDSKEKKGKKKARDWNALSGVPKNAVDPDAVKELNRGQDRLPSESLVEESLEILCNPSEDEISESSSDEIDVPKDEESRGPSKRGKGLFSFFSDLVSGRPLTSDDLIKPLEAMRQNLLAKNVALSIADKICQSVSESIVGQKVSSFQSIYSMVKRAFEDSCTRILTPNRNIDVIAEINLIRHRESRPYTIVFVGVNGVGKSTSLAKICYYLLARNLKVSIAACDTFRSGAVEQLMTHARRLGVQVHHQGYNKDASSVAADAIRAANKSGDDVLLIDTAGRMQDNEPLMRALSKLIVQNEPDLILFVGEALVGNDAVDQLEKFNRALADLSKKEVPRLIDGIVLTKFDTIGDKVGAAVSMTYTTGQPIVFVGVGQDYGDIRRLSVKTLVHKLLA